MITILANSLFIIFTLLIILFLVLNSLNKRNDLIDKSGQSERQIKNDDYNSNYHP
jgi:hypothetical protein